MNAHDMIAGVVVLLGLIAALGLARQMYLLAIFRITAEKREMILRAAYLFDEKHDLNPRELAFLSFAIQNVYKHRVKRRMAYSALRALRNRKGRKSAKSQGVMREEVHQVAMALSALSLYENPLCAILLLMHVVKATKDTKLAKDKGPLARAETVVAQQTPEFSDRRTRFHDEIAFC